MSRRRIDDFAHCDGRRRTDRRSARGCGCLEFYDIKARRQFKCAACHHQFSATSGTIFASHRLSFVELLGAICLFVNASKGLSAVQMSRDLDVQYKTAFVLMHKLREGMARERTGSADRFGLGDYGHAHAPPRQIRGDRRARAPALLDDVGPEPREQDDVGEAVAGRGADEIGDEGRPAMGS